MKVKTTLGAIGLSMGLLVGQAFADENKAPSIDLTGTWNVVSTPTWSTCPSRGTKSAYQWILSQNGRSVSITVVGETGFPKLDGAFKSAKDLTLDGISKKPVISAPRAIVFASSAF